MVTKKDVITISLDKEIIQKIHNLRGLTPFSTFINNFLQEKLK